MATNNEQLAEKMRLMRNFGFAGYDNVIYPGTNGKLTEIAAAMGLTNLQALQEFIRCKSAQLPRVSKWSQQSKRSELGHVRRIGAE